MVKDYDESPDYCVASQVSQMYHDLEELHKLGILVINIHAGNYLGGKLTNFSMSRTKYHICIDRADLSEVSRIRLLECERFE